MKINPIEQNKPSFKMAIRFSQGTTLKDLQQHALKNAAIKNNDSILLGLDQLIKNNANNKHFDIIFDKANGGTYDIVSKTTSANFIHKYIDMKEEIIDKTLSKIIKYKKK